MTDTKLFDPGVRPEHEKALGMLEKDVIAWFTTVAEDGSPHAVPVWFMWHEGRIVVFSEPDTVKVAHVRRGSRVLVHLEAGGPHGDDVVILSGSAEIDPSPSLEYVERFRDAYTKKYDEAIEAFGMAPDDLLAKYSAAIVMTP
ncbi:MAG: pyridoxamine 5'-phosphate oxidase family protein, partial [Microbacterium sp.]